MKIFDNLRKWLASRKAKGDLIKRYVFDLEVSRIMESWVTKRILEGQSGRRQELLDLQQKIKETGLFIDFLRKL
jgi:hypothetical protein